MTVTKQWQELLAQMSWADLSGDEVEAGKRLLIDALGIASAGAQAEGVSGTLAVLAQLGTGTVPVPWAGVHLPPAQAGLALSALIHAWDFDDTHDQAVVHTLAVALPAAVAAGAHAGRSGADILNGVVVGVQVLSRLSLLLGGQRGMIRTAGLGSIAAAAAAARTLGLDGEGIGNAMALALPASGSPSSRQVVEDSAVSKRLQPGLGVQAGVTAAFLAQNGVAGPHGWLEGSYGLFALAGEQGLGLYTLLASGWEGANVWLK